MYYTYILRSLKTIGAIYIGSTNNLRRRLQEHNSEENEGYTKRHSPWEIESYFAFSSELKARNFESYLKSHAGKAFLHKRLITGSFSAEVKLFNNGRK